ncbi:helix-turn-helix transcriptional regulator [Paeniglutamicibacter antarcticus]|uniref:helix-turn-helix domain-containing protein n=1 Tax=Paeniglutamicibacter antarcticus TaxID=494023 RepID=UPI0031EA9348
MYWQQRKKKNQSSCLKNLTSADLRPLRLALGLTQVVAASALGCWTTAISRIERGLCRDCEAIERYRTWLEKQVTESS